MGCNCTKNVAPKESEITRGEKNNPPQDSTKIKEKNTSEYLLNGPQEKKDSQRSGTNKGENDQDKFKVIEPTTQKNDNNALKGLDDIINKPPFDQKEKPYESIEHNKIDINPNLNPSSAPPANIEENPVENNKIQRQSSKIKANYNTEALKLINKIRQNPQSFINDIEEAKNKIETKQGKLIYAGKVKVAIKEGEAVFDEAIECLRNLQEMQPLILDDNITIPVPDDEERIKTSKTLNELVEAKKEEGVQIEMFFKDSVKDYYTSVLLLVIDDSGKGKSKKRNALLNPNYTKIGLSNRKINKTFAAYYTFA